MMEKDKHKKQYAVAETATTAAIAVEIARTKPNFSTQNAEKKLECKHMTTSHLDAVVEDGDDDAVAGVPNLL